MKHWFKNDYITLILRLLLLYVLLFLCRIVFYLMNIDSLGAIASVGEFFSLLRGSLVFDTVSILYANGVFICFSLVPFRFRETKGYQRFLFWMYTLINSALIIVLNVADSLYFHTAKKRITAEEFHFAGNDNTGSLVLKFIGENWYLVLIAAALIWGLVWSYKRIPYWRLSVRNPFAYFGISILLLAFSSGIMVGLIRGGFSRQIRPIAMSNAAQYAPTHQKASLILSNPFCVIRTFGSTRIEVPDYFSAAELETVFTPYHYPAPDTLHTPKRNIVIFTLESFSSEHSAFLNPDLYPDGQGYTPFLDSLMGRSHTFMNAFSNGRKSIDALPSVLTSIPSYKKPFVLLPQSLGEVRGLPRLLGEEGYTTSFFCGSQRNSMGFAAFASLAGVQEIYMQEEYKALHGMDEFDGYWGIWDEPFLQFMGETLTDMQQPFFASAFTLSSHHPFEVPEKYKGTFREGTTKMHIPVQYSDQSLKRFFEYARTQEWYKNTIFIFSADHVSSEIYAEKTKTPTGNSSIIMFIYAPDDSLAHRDYRTAQQLDLMPTALGMIGYERPYFAFGRDVFREPERLPVATNYSNESYQLITDSIVLFSTGGETLFAYDRADTLQHTDIRLQNTPAQQEGERLLKGILQQYYRHLEEKSYVVP